MARRTIFIRSASATVSPDIDVTDWVNRIVAKGGTVSAPRRTALDVLTAGLKADGLWSEIIDYNPMYGDDVIGAQEKLKWQTQDEYLNYNFVSGDYDPILGLTGDGSTKYFNTRVSIPPQAQTSTMLGFFRSVNVGHGSTVGCVMGSSYTPGIRCYCLDTNTAAGDRTGWGSYTSTTSNMTGTGLFMFGAEDSVTPVFVEYKNATQLTSTAGTYAWQDGGDFYVFSGAGVAPCLDTLGGAIITKGLTAAQVTMLSARMNTFAASRV